MNSKEAIKNVADVPRKFDKTGGTLSGEVQMNGKAIRLTTNNNGYARLGYESSTNDVFISNYANNLFRLKSDKTITYGGHKVYSAFDKPTPTEIGAADLYHSHDYLPLSGGSITGETTFNNYLSVNSWPGHGTGKAKFWYDGNSKNLVIENATTLRLGNNILYHTGNKPTASDIGALPSSKVTISQTAPNNPSTGDVWISW